MEKASPEQLPALVEGVPADLRGEVLGGFLDRFLPQRKTPSKEVLAVLAACRDAAPELLAERVAKCLRSAVPENPAGWGSVFSLLPEPTRRQVGAELAALLAARGATRAAWLEWSPLLRDMGRDLPDPAVLEGMARSVVPLRCAGRPCLGIVVAVDEEELVVLSQTTADEEGEWQVATGSVPECRWVAATSCEGSAACRLLRFPTTDAIPRTRAAVLDGTPTGTILDVRLPAEEGEWLWRPVSVADASRTLPAGAGSACFLQDGKLVCLRSGTAVLGAAELRRMLEPWSAPRGSLWEDGSLVVSFTMHAGAGDLPKSVAMVRSGVSDAACREASDQYRGNPREPCLPDADEFPLAVAGDEVVLRIPVSPGNVRPLLVQIRHELADGSRRYDPPLVACGAGERPAGTGDWLVSEARRQALAAGVGGGPVPLRHTVDGRRDRYGRVEVTSLALAPLDLVPDASCEHVYVGDRHGIRRIRLAGFQETVGVPFEAQSVRLCGTSAGLVVVLSAGGLPEVRVLDPTTLAEKGRSALSFAPTHVAGAWRAPLLAALSREQTEILNIAAGKRLMQCATRDLMGWPKKTKHGRAGTPDQLLDIQATPAGDMLCILGGHSLRRLRLSADGGLETLRETDIGTCGEARQGVLTVDPGGCFATAGNCVFGLRGEAVVAVLDTSPHRPLAILDHGRAILAATELRGGGAFFSVLDWRGVPNERWDANGAKLDLGCRAIPLPGGRRSLLWGQWGACMVELLGEAGRSGL